MAGTKTTSAKPAEKMEVTRSYGLSIDHANETVSIGVPISSSINIGEISTYVDKKAWEGIKSGDTAKTVELKFVDIGMPGYRHIVVSAHATTEGIPAGKDRDIELKKFVDGVTAGILEIINNTVKIKLRKEAEAGGPDGKTASKNEDALLIYAFGAGLRSINPQPFDKYLIAAFGRGVRNKRPLKWD